MPSNRHYGKGGSSWPSLQDLVEAYTPDWWQQTAPPTGMGPIPHQPGATSYGAPSPQAPVQPGVAQQQQPIQQAGDPRMTAQHLQDFLDFNFGKQSQQGAGGGTLPPVVPGGGGATAPPAPAAANQGAQPNQDWLQQQLQRMQAVRNAAGVKAGFRKGRLQAGSPRPTLQDQAMAGVAAPLNSMLLNGYMYGPQMMTNQLNDAFSQQAQLNQLFGSQARDRESRERISTQAIEAISNLFGGGGGGGGGGYQDTNSTLSVGGANNATGNITAQSLPDQMIRNADQIVRSTPAQIQQQSTGNSGQQQNELNQRLASRLRQLAPMIERNMTPENQGLQQSIQMAKAQQDLGLRGQVGLPMQRNDLAQLQTQMPMLMQLIQGLG